MNVCLYVMEIQLLNKKGLERRNTMNSSNFQNLCKEFYDIKNSSYGL